MRHFLLFYDTDDDFLARRATHRQVHLKHAWDAAQRGDLVLGGALMGGEGGALLLFRGESPEVAEAFAREDPYVTNGLVKTWRVREWTTDVGEDAASVVRP
jgi:uncharacterized protein YciI